MHQTPGTQQQQQQLHAYHNSVNMVGMGDFCGSCLNSNAFCSHSSADVSHSSSLRLDSLCASLNRTPMTTTNSHANSQHHHHHHCNHQRQTLCTHMHTSYIYTYACTATHMGTIIKVCCVAAAAAARLAPHFAPTIHHTKSFTKQTREDTRDTLENMPKVCMRAFDDDVVLLLLLMMAMTNQPINRPTNQQQQHKLSEMKHVVFFFGFFSPAIEKIVILSIAFHLKSFCAQHLYALDCTHGVSIQSFCICTYINTHTQTPASRNHWPQTHNH